LRCGIRMTDETKANDEKPWLFKPGNRLGGRTKGSRNKLSEQFFVDFVQAWEQHGAEALSTVAQTDPSTFVRVAATLMPKEYVKVVARRSFPRKSRSSAWTTCLTTSVQGGSDSSQTDSVSRSEFVAGAGGAADGAEAEIKPH
jgi:hypothetical protein